MEMINLYSFEIFSDSACDLSDAFIKEFDIGIVPFSITFDGQSYAKERLELSLSDFYNELLSRKVFPKTSLPSISDYSEHFRPSLEKGLDVLCICLSSKFSGSYQSAVNAKNLLEDEFPERTIIIADSMLATILQGQMAVTAAKLRKAGKTINEVYDAIANLKDISRIYVTVDSLEYLQRGGRIGKVSAFAGTLFDIKPIIELKDGELNPLSKVRGRKKAISNIIELAFKGIDNLDDYEFGIVHSACFAEAKQLEETLKNTYGIKDYFGITELGATIGSHIGPTVLGISCIKKII